MYEHHLQLFSKKDMYIMSCSDSGMNRVMMSLTTAKRRKLKTGNLHLTKGMKFTQTNGFPILDAYTGPTDFTSYPYTMHHKLDGKNQALHFFLDDYKFEEATGKKLEQTTYRLARFDYLFTPDYSLYVDAPIHFNKDNIFKSRFAGAYWQNCGFHVIPTVSWGNVNSFVYAFEGLPQQSVLATCGVGYQHCHASKTLWEYAIQRIEAELSPIELIIYGKPTDIPGIHTPIKFIPDYISTHLRK